MLMGKSGAANRPGYCCLLLTRHPRRSCPASRRRLLWRSLLRSRCRTTRYRLEAFNLVLRVWVLVSAWPDYHFDCHLTADELVCVLKAAKANGPHNGTELLAANFLRLRV